MRRLFFFLMIALLLPQLASAQAFEWEPRDHNTNGQPYFDTEHHEEYIQDALRELTGKPPRPDATREELAEITLGLLNDLPEYGQKEVAMVQPPVANWLLAGYRVLNPTCVSHSRYLDAVADQELTGNSEIGALYAFWCTYDAEWFALSRHADYKAWLSAVLVHFPPQWQDLRGESAESLHDRLVVPLQTPDEPYREIDNWINNFAKNSETFIKPKVRDALVQELIDLAGLESDSRYFEDEAYEGLTPEGLGLSEREFYLLAALTLEFSQEIYELDPTTKQPYHFRQYFLHVFAKESRPERIAERRNRS
ncbi:hypothetical protein JW859_05290 [bacterium]|nr:hypothetical protein [bacterium]